jgi:serine/threonine-protein kinase
VPEVAGVGAEEESLIKVAGVSPGQVLCGKYRVDRFLAVGAMGAVVAAHHVQLETTVAIKILLPEMVKSEQAVARFAREAKAAVRITNEHVARVFDVGALESGLPFIVMEFLEGFDLGTLLQKQGPLAGDTAVDFVLQACEAVAEAHSLGTVHRDLKPSNLFCVERADGSLLIKVLDFGVSKVTQVCSEDLARTLVPSVMGSPLYMSPEQIEASPNVDARADIWAFGVILCELLTGVMPFSGESLPEVSVKIAKHPPLVVRESIVPTHMRDHLEAVILRCLEKDPALRFQTVSELAEALLPVAPPHAKASVQRIVEATRRRTLRPYAPSGRPGAESIAGVGGSHHDRLATSTKRGSAHFFAACLLLATVAVSAYAAKRIRPAAPTRVDSAGSSNIGIERLAAPPADAPEVGTTEGTLVAHPLPPPAAEPVVSQAAVSPLPEKSARPRGGPRALPRTAPNAAVARGVSHPASQPSAAVPDCSPNYFFDEQGHKSFKPECLSEPPVSDATSAVKPGCDPNFVFDDQGRRHFKPECF